MGEAFALTFVVSILMGCLDSVENKKLTYEQPQDFPETYYPFERNPLDPQKVALGKKLFFDAQLSRDGSISCSTCHQQARAFSDAPQHILSIGVDDRRGKRNTPTLQNLAYIPEFAWDGGISHLDFTIANAVTATIEMDQSMADVVTRLAKDSSYIELFNDAWQGEISGVHIQLSIAQFLLTLVSHHSKYDKSLAGAVTLSADELAGKQLYEEHCSRCHKGMLFSSSDFYKFHDQGMKVTSADSGRGRITNDPKDFGAFRVHTLRNIEVSAPYMHDGRFETLEEVITHFSENESALDQKSIQQLVVFLKTLTDWDFLQNENFHKNI